MGLGTTDEGRIEELEKENERTLQALRAVYALIHPDTLDLMVPPEIRVKLHAMAVAEDSLPIMPLLRGSAQREMMINHMRRAASAAKFGSWDVGKESFLHMAKLIFEEVNG